MKPTLTIAASAFLLSSAAFAADLGRMLSPPVGVTAPHQSFYGYGAPAFTWTGFYVGGQIGYAWGNDSTALFLDGERLTFDGLGGLFGDSIKYDIDGVVGGAHAGFNLQYGNFVFGLEGDVEAADLNGTRSATEQATVSGVAVNGSASARTDLNWIASIRGRLGFAFERMMVYGTAGVAFADVEHTYTASGTVFGIGVQESTTFSDTRTGWTVGGGLEYLLSNDLTTRMEYRYTTFDSFENGIFRERTAGFDLIAEQEPDFTLFGPASALSGKLLRRLR